MKHQELGSSSPRMLPLIGQTNARRYFIVFSCQLAGGGQHSDLSGEVLSCKTLAVFLSHEVAKRVKPAEAGTGPIVRSPPLAETGGWPTSNT